MAQTEAWTVGRLLGWTADFLKRHGAETPRLEAEVLLAEVLGCRRIELYTRFEDVPPDDARTAFRDLVRRRSEGTPVAYLVGRREFYSMDFRVTPDVLIPRPDTEHVVIALLDHAKGAAAERPRICDVGTGSGIIAVCAAKHLPRAEVTALDLSSAALEVARGNARQHGVEERIEFVESDLFAAVPPGASFDVVASNPPYIATAEMAELARDVRDYEPRAALEAGPQGTEVIERLIPQAAEHLAPGGLLLIEISPRILDAVTALLAAQPKLEPGPVIKDLARLPRVVQATRRAEAPAA